MKTPTFLAPRPALKRGRPLTLMHTAGAAHPADSLVLFLGLFAAYVVLMGLAYTAQSGLVKALGNVYAVVIFGLVAFGWASRVHPPSRWSTTVLLCYVVYLTGIACSVIVNSEHIDWADLVKIIMVPAFLLFGAAFERHRLAKGEPRLWQRSDVRVMLAVLIAVPLLTWAGQLLQSGFQIDGVRETSIFANRNNAAAYAITLLGIVAVVLGQPVRSLVVFMAVGIMFGTLGALLAVIIAMALTVAKPRELLILALLLVATAAGYSVWPEQKPFVRFTPVFDSIRYIAEGRIDLYTTTYAELVLLLKTSDLSFVFRLKHWVDLLSLWGQSDLYHWLFGFGVGSSVRDSDERLVPHNDYLRLLFEFGLVTLLAFVAVLALVFVRLGRRWEVVPFLTMVIYMFSENLIHNFTAMAFMFFSVGVLVERVALEREKDLLLPPGAVR
jgi:hypothetical protein